MKHLVLITGIYYPQPSPTGKCARQYISLIKDKFNIDIIYIQSGLERHYGVINNDETLYGLSNWRLLIETWLQEQSRKATSKLLRTLSAIGVIGIKFIGRIQSVVLFPNNLRWFYKNALDTLCDIHKENPIDVIFTVNSPFSAHIAGEAFKKIYPSVRWVTYTVDPFHVEHNRKRRNKKSWSSVKAFSAEKKIIDYADYNFLSEEVYNFSDKLYENACDKTYPLPYLLPYNSNQGDDRFNSSKINLVYAGRFYKDIRNPEYLLQSFLLTKDENIILHLYAASDCETLIEKYVRKSNGRIIRHELVNSQEILKVLSSADILINIGNTLPEFKPSKTFEYIATGRPIINLYQYDLKDEILGRHPIVLQISTNMDHRNAAQEIEKFCVNNNGIRIPLLDIEKIYEDNSNKKIREILLKGIIGDYIN